MQRTYTLILFLLMASIDNTTIGVLPAVYVLISRDLGVREAELGVVNGLNLLVIALAAVFWGYRSDQVDRRRLLIFGTLLWVVPIGALSVSTSYLQLLIFYGLAGLGVGCVAIVGYSVITDLISPKRRGLMLSLWGLTQGVGTLLGPALLGLLGTESWRTPFALLAGTGVLLAFLALFTASPRKGEADLEFQQWREEYGEREYRINRRDLRTLLRQPTNRLLMLQGFTAQLAYGTLQWLPAFFAVKLIAQGTPLESATGIAALLYTVAQFGGIFSVLWGYLGDRLQRRNLGGRAILAAIGTWASIPAYLLLLWLPLPMSTILPGTAPPSALLGALTTNAWLWAVLGAAVLATAANSTNAPSWYALVTDVNLPEHRGTAFSLISLAASLGRAVGGAASGVAVVLLSGRTPVDLSPDQPPLAAPTDYALGLSVFVLFFLLTGMFFMRAARTAPASIREVRETLRLRGTRRRPIVLP